MAKLTSWTERRRVATRRATPLRAMAAGLVQLARAAFAEPYQLAVERHAVGLRRLPRELDGFRIVHLSDIHHSPFTGRQQVERAVEVANSLQPDIIALTGDYVSHEREYVQPCADMLGRLRARRGVYAVLGNHDNWVDADLVTDLFTLAGIRVLNNEGMRFEDGGASFWLAGVDDTMVGLEDLPLALAGSSADELKLLLAHNPIVLRARGAASAVSSSSFRSTRFTSAIAVRATSVFMFGRSPVSVTTSGSTLAILPRTSVPSCVTTVTSVPAGMFSIASAREHEDANVSATMQLRASD